MKAQHWEDLSRAVRASVESPLDELIFLRKEASPIYHPPRGAKLLRYDKESDILTSLAYKTASRFNPEAKPFVPLVQQASVLIPEEGVSDDESVVEEPVNESVQDVEIEVSPIDPSVHRTEKEIAATKSLQSLYRRRLDVMSKANSEVARIRSLMYVKSRIENDKLDVSRHYRHMFLGPLPHVLTALQGCEMGIQRTKKDYKKRLLNAKNFNVDQENELMTTCKYVPSVSHCLRPLLSLPLHSRLRKTWDRLWKDVEPSSELHRRGPSSEPDLKQRVEEINDFFQEVVSAKISDLEEFAWDLEIGYKGIARVAHSPRPTSKVAKRPSLNTEDLDQ